MGLDTEYRSLEAGGPWLSGPAWSRDTDFQQRFRPQMSCMLYLDVTPKVTVGTSRLQMTEWYQPSNKVSLGLVVKTSYGLTVGKQRFHLKKRV